MDKNSKFTFFPNKHYSISDIVVCFYYNTFIYVVPLSICAKKNIVHFEDMTLYTSKETLLSCVFLTKNVKMKDDKLVIDNEQYDDDEILHDDSIKKIETHVDVLKNIVVNNNAPIYYYDINKSNKNDSKKICYLIVYRNGQNLIKYSVIKSNNDKDSYDYKKSGYEKYFNNYKKDMNVKNAFVYPMSSSSANKLSIKYKIINI